jgi:uncharacterized protein (TIGR02001 family)
MKSLGLKLALAAGTLVTLATTAAQADDDWGTVSAYVAVTSDYRYRGISQNNREVAPQASINWSIGDGFYVGTWVSKTDWLGLPIIGGNPSYEADFYAGKHFDLGGWDLNVEAYYYSYPDANKLIYSSTASYFEGIFQLSHSFGDLSLTATGAVSPEWSLGGGTGGYIAGTASYPLTDWLSLSGTVGHQWVDAAPSDYTHFDIGLTATWHSWSLDVRANGTDMNSATCGFYMTTASACTTGVVATLTYNIADILN